jgi:hypothetical protein
MSLVVLQDDLNTVGNIISQLPATPGFFEVFQIFEKLWII